jgi:hypothetical protein
MSNSKIPKTPSNEQKPEVSTMSPAAPPPAKRAKSSEVTDATQKVLCFHHPDVPHGEYRFYWAYLTKEQEEQLHTNSAPTFKGVIEMPEKHFFSPLDDGTGLVGRPGNVVKCKIEPFVPHDFKICMTEYEL